MRAVGLDYQHRSLEMRDVPEPVPTSDQVLLRVREVGICGTDRELAAFQFGYPPKGQHFLTLGHEALAIVEQDAGDFKRGEWVIPMVRRPCVPACRSCARNRRDLCVTGGYVERGIFGAHGYFAEFAADRAEDLVRVPENLVEVAVLIEPASVTEKAVDAALRLHQETPETALVIGAGPVGILAGCVLALRGMRVAIHSREPSGSPRARLLEKAGLKYLHKIETKFDVVIEAAGVPEAADAGIRALGPLGVMIVVGAKISGSPVPWIDLIVNNQAIAGVVNASPQAFQEAVRDLHLMPHDVLRQMIHRLPFTAFRATIAGTPTSAPKSVHVID